MRLKLKWLFIPTVYFVVIGFLFIFNDAKARDCFVVKVTDGDTFRCIAEDQLVKVRIKEIDAPELKQPYGVESKKYLESLIDKKTVSLEKEETDMYNRTLAKVSIQGKDLASELVKGGSVWVYDRYAENPSLENHEKLASYSKVGLWGSSENAPIQPWLWRRNN